MNGVSTRAIVTRAHTSRHRGARIALGRVRCEWRGRTVLPPERGERAVELRARGHECLSLSRNHPHNKRLTGSPTESTPIRGQRAVDLRARGKCLCLSHGTVSHTSIRYNPP